MSKLYRHHYNEADDPEVARLEKQRDRKNKARRRRKAKQDEKQDKHYLADTIVHWT